MSEDQPAPVDEPMEDTGDYDGEDAEDISEVERQPDDLADIPEDEDASAPEPPDDFELADPPAELQDGDTQEAGVDPDVLDSTEGASDVDE